MTSKHRQTALCKHCGNPTGIEEPWKAWLRSHPGLDSIRECLVIGDPDLWILKYGTRLHPSGVDRAVQYLMFAEVKSHGVDLEDWQRDQLGIVNDLLRTNPWKEQRANGRLIAGHPQNVRIVKSLIAGKKIPVYCYGAHLLRFSGIDPASSEWIEWDRKRIDLDQLISLLRYDIHPDSLRPMEHRMHKTRYQPPAMIFEEFA